MSRYRGRPCSATPFISISPEMEGAASAANPREATRAREEPGGVSTKEAPCERGAPGATDATRATRAPSGRADAAAPPSARTARAQRTRGISDVDTFETRGDTRGVPRDLAGRGVNPTLRKMTSTRLNDASLSSTSVFGEGHLVPARPRLRRARATPRAASRPPSLRRWVHPIRGAWTTMGTSRVGDVRSARPRLST